MAAKAGGSRCLSHCVSRRRRRRIAKRFGESAGENSFAEDGISGDDSFRVRLETHADRAKRRVSSMTEAA